MKTDLLTTTFVWFRHYSEPSWQWSSISQKNKHSLLVQTNRQNARTKFTFSPCVVFYERSPGRHWDPEEGGPRTAQSHLWTLDRPEAARAFSARILPPLVTKSPNIWLTCGFSNPCIFVNFSVISIVITFWRWQLLNENVIRFSDSGCSNIISLDSPPEIYFSIWQRSATMSGETCYC